MAENPGHIAAPVSRSTALQVLLINQYSRRIRDLY
jgi:hypothetical protein